MDVERLMRDLSVEQLDNIHKDLQTKVEQRKEELREMVGRRYRDVLDAATEVRAVHAAAQKLADTVAHARNTDGLAPDTTVTARRGAASVEDAGVIQRFLALHRILPLIGADTEGCDALSDAFAMLLVEHLHRRLATERRAPEISIVLTALTHRLLRTRRELVARLNDELGELGVEDWAACQLSAQALLAGESCDLNNLLDNYLDARAVCAAILSIKNVQKFLGELEESAPLLRVVTEIRSTLQVVEALFVQGGLSTTLHAVAAPGWRPEVIDSLIGDQAFGFAKVLETDVDRVNRALRDRKFNPIPVAKVSEKCTQWVQKVSKLVKGTVKVISESYEKTDDLIEFVQALGAIFRDNWPRVSSCTEIYTEIFGTTIIDKFKALCERDLRELATTLCAGADGETPGGSASPPPPLFRKRAGHRFDPMHDVGTTPILENAVATFETGVRQVASACERYTKVGLESGLESLGDDLATIIQRLVTESIAIVDEKETSLWRARVCLGLLHSHPSAICTTLSRRGERVAACSQALHQTAELTLLRFALKTIEETWKETRLDDVETVKAIVDASEDALEFEKVELPDVGVVGVPMTLSKHWHSWLAALAKKAHDTGVGHLFTKTIRKRVGEEIGTRAATVFSAVVSTTGTGKSQVSPRLALQTLFDAKVLLTIFEAPSLRSVIPKLETVIDPFDLTLLGPLITRNVKLAAQRSQLHYSEWITGEVSGGAKTGGGQPPASQAAVVDIVPSIASLPRIALIPRLTRAAAEEASGLQKAPKSGYKERKSEQGMKPTGSLSTFYGKASSWFGGGN